MPEPSAIEVASCSSRSQTMLPALVLGMAAFLTQFDVTAVVVAMPAIGSALGFGVAHDPCATWTRAVSLDDLCLTEPHHRP
jgi:hypothetical protein